MATTKVKGTSKKIKELKGIEDIRPEKITDEQLEKVQSVINEINRSQLEIGASEVKKHEILHRIANFRDTLSDLQLELEKEYGTYDVDLQTGAINYGDDDEANS